MSVVSRRYARALLDTLSPDRVDRGLEQLRRAAAVLEEYPTARQFLLNPAVPADRRERFIAELALAIELEPPVHKLLALLVDRRRLDILDDLIQSYQTIYDEKAGIVRAAVTTADSMSTSEQQELIRRLEAATGKRVVMELAADTEIIGGLIVRIGSTVFDGSIRQHLTGFKARLLAG